MKTRRIPLRDFFRNPKQAAFDVSPDGRSISFLGPYRRRLNLFVQDRATGRTRRVTGETERDITGGYLWKGSDRLVYLKDTQGDENFHLLVADARSGAGRDLTPFPGVRTDLVDELKDDDRAVLVCMNRRRQEVFDVYRLDILTGDLRLAAENPGNVTRWVTDHDGRLRAAVTSDGVDTTLLYRASESEAFRPVLTTTFKETFSPLFFTFDNQRIFGISNIGRDKSAVVEFDPAASRETRTIYEHPEVDVQALVYSRKRKTLLAARYCTWKQQREFFDPEFESMIRDLEERLPGYELGIAAHDKAEDVFVVRTSSDRSMGAYYLYERQARKLSKLADLSPWLHEDELAAMKPISYQSRDGLSIHGYLTLPVGAPAQGLPVVLNPHGGPWHRDAWGFDPEAQFLASRGYGVLQVNFRGSTGYGRRFWEASFKEWGRKMQDDLTDGVAFLVREGVADPGRVAIYGGSYGGYASLAGAAFTPDLYACVVDYVGISNLFTFMKTIPPYWKPYLDMIHEMVGDPDRDKDLLTAASPVFHADRIKAPLLVAQGAKDPRVNVDESDQIVASLRRRGVKVEYLVKANEGHGFRNEENKFDFYRAMEKFLARHLKPKT